MGNPNIVRCLKVVMIIASTILIVHRVRSWGTSAEAPAVRPAPSRIEVLDSAMPDTSPAIAPSLVREVVAQMEGTDPSKRVIRLRIEDSLGVPVTDAEIFDRLGSPVAFPSLRVDSSWYTFQEDDLNGLRDVYCVAAGFVPKAIELVDAVNDYHVVLRRPGRLVGRVVGVGTPTLALDVIAFRSDIEVRSAKRILERSDLDDEARVARGVCATRSLPDGSFSITGVEEGVSYELAAFGLGVVCTRRRAIHKSGNDLIELPCAIAYAKRVGAIDEAGNEVRVFSHSFHGAMSTAWYLQGSGTLVNALNSSFVLAGIDSVFSTPDRAERRFVATSEIWGPTLDSLYIQVDAPGFESGIASLALDRIDLPSERKNLVLKRTGVCHGSLLVCFGAEHASGIPNSTVRLRSTGVERWISFKLSNGMVDDRFECLVENIPCGEYAFEFEDEISGWKWPSTGGETRIVVTSSSPSRCEIPLESRRSLVIRLFGAGLQDWLDDGEMTISLGAASQNPDFVRTKKLKASYTRPVGSIEHVIDGVAPGKYELVILGKGRLLASRSVDVRVAEDWNVSITLSDSGN